MRKNIFKYAFMAACATVLLAACSKEEKIEVGDWNSTSDYAVVSFVETNKTIELDPTESTTYTLHMGRRNPELSEAIEAEEKRVEELLQQDGLSKEDSTKLINGLEESIAKMSKANLPAIEVPIVITDDGGNETFTISSAKFEEGEWLGKYTISFPKAEVGTTYSVQYAVQDPQYVSYYSSDVTATFSVTRVKWVSVGKADFYDWYFEKNSEVEVLMKDGDPTMFRIMHPYDIIAAGAQSVPSSDYVQLNLLKVGQTLEGVKITQPDLVYFTPIHTGYVHPNYGKEVVTWHPADLYASPNEDMYLKSYVMGYQKKTIEGKEYTIPGAINLAPYYYMSGVGGWNATSEDPGSRIIFDGFKLKYEADIFTEGDFEWEPVFEGALTSTKLEQSGTGVLYKGKCVATTDDADKRFEEAYGTPYLFKEPYAEGYDIVFFVKNGRISIPKDYAEAFEYQETGLEAAKEPIYAKINPSSSSFADNEVILDIDFVFLDNEGNATQTFAKDKLTLAYITWSKVATGTFYYVMFSETDDPEPDPGYSLYKRDDKDNVFKIGEWLMGTDFMFTWDKTSNKCVVLEQAINYEHPSYGPMYIMEGANYSDDFAAHTSYYDPATKIFHFFPAYFVNAGSFGQVEEFFEITEEGGVKQLVPAWNNAKLKAKDRKPGMWQGCIVSKKASNREIKVIKKAGKKEFESVKQAGNGTFAF